jgi:hypothetical protein
LKRNRTPRVATSAERTSNAHNSEVTVSLIDLANFGRGKKTVHVIARSRRLVFLSLAPWMFQNS